MTRCIIQLLYIIYRTLFVMIKIGKEWLYLSCIFHLS